MKKICKLGDWKLVEGGHAAEMTAAVMDEWLHSQQLLCGSNNSLKYDWFVKLALLQVYVCTHVICAYKKPSDWSPKLSLSSNENCKQ